jgi:hypothetical protein
MSQKYPGGLITKTPVVPGGPFQDGAASGIWTVDQAMQYTKQGIWPTAGLQRPFDETRILIPYMSGTYSFDPYLYNWNTNTLTAMTSQSEFYPAGSENVNVVIDPNKNIYAFGSASTNSGSYKNMMYLAAGSTNPSYYRVDPFTFSTYGSYFSQITWNPTQNRVQCATFPHYNIGGTPYTVTFDNAGSYSTYSGGAGGWQNPGMALLTTKNTSGTVTYGSYIVASGDSDSLADNSYIWSDATPWTTPAWTQSSQTTGNPSRSWVIGLPSAKALVVVFSTTYVYTPASNTFTNVTTALDNAGGVSESINYGLAGMWEDAFCCYNADAIKVVKGDPSGTISWCTSLTSFFSGRKIYMAWGVGTTLWVLSTITGGGTWYITKFEFTVAGVATRTDRTLSGLTSTKTVSLTGLQYF